MRCRFVLEDQPPHHQPNDDAPQQEVDKAEQSKVQRQMFIQPPNGQTRADQTDDGNRNGRGKGPGHGLPVVERKPAVDKMCHDAGGAPSHGPQQPNVNP